MKNDCPNCKCTELTHLYNCIVPTLQNKVYDSQNKAFNCTQGTIDLALCPNCNLTFNSSFDEKKIIYDEDYDNAVPSDIFSNYYATICKYLYQNYHLENGIVYDVGCGKGTFLKMLCEMYPNIEGVGIDPSYEGNLNPMSNLFFIRDFFKHEHVPKRPSLILSRHVFEHIEFSKDFLKIINEPIRTYDDVPVFIEVPDFQWIVENKTFWDLCYEHCNYFSERSLKEVFHNTWSKLTKISKAFNNQYLWVEGILNPEKKDISNYFPHKIETHDIQIFIDSIDETKRGIRERIVYYKNDNFGIVVWGMATKGVIFTNIIDNENTLIEYCIDINEEKQDKYSPISGHLISNPKILETISYTKIVIIIMNSNYVDEIKAFATKYSCQIIFIDAHGYEI